jgi:UbiD family decarboxylase
MISDLRTLINVLETENELIRIKEEVELDYQITAFCRLVSDEDGPGLLFERVKGHTMPIAVNLFGTRRRIALALETTEQSMTDHNLERIKAPLSPKINDYDFSDWVVMKDDDIDLYKLPHPTWNVGDGGPFITAGVVIAAQTGGGFNGGIYRMQIHSKNTCGVYMAPDHHVRRLLESPDRKDPVEISVALGPPPALFIAASSDFGVNESEVSIAGALQGQALEFSPGMTVNVPCPVQSEIIIEGVLDGAHEEEGPFVEFTGYATGSGPSPLMKVTAIYHRPEPIYHAAYVGKPPNETATVWREIEESVALNLLQQRFPIVRGLHRPAQIGRDFLAVIQVDAERAKPGMIGNLLLGCAYCLPRPKYVIVVDNDIDIYRLEDVLWAMGTRVDPQRDSFFAPNTMTSGLDPTGPTPPLTSKLLIDATKKEGFRGRVNVPTEDAFEFAKKILANYK